MQVSANGIAIEVDDSGPAGAEPVLLIMGLGMQLIAWPDELVRELVERGFRVVRFDNRDVGLSQGFDHLGFPSLLAASVRYMLRLPIRSPYRLADMASDAFGVLDALRIERAHVCGVSMGGMIAQHMAASRPERVKSLTLAMTSSGARALPQATAQARRVLLARPANPRDRAAIVDHLVRLLTVIGSPGYPPDPVELRRRCEAFVARAWRPAGTVRHLVAVAADGDRSSMLARIHVPTRIVHGAADPLIPVPAAHDLLRRIRGATIDVIDGMGHDLPAALMPRLARAIGAAN